MDGGRQAILRAVDDLSPRIIQLLQEFIRIPTVNPPGEAYQDFVDYMGDVLDELGYAIEVIAVPGHRLDELAPLGQGRPRPNLVARLGGDGDGLRVVLNGHYDVVPAGNDWRRDPFGGEVDGGKVYGRGAADQKSGLVSGIFAVEALRRAGVRWTGRITHTAVPNEETVGNTNAGTGFLVEQGVISRENTDAVIITEPFGPAGVGIGHKGAIWGEITVLGKQAHGSSPLLGVNAVELMAGVLAEIGRELQPQLRLRVADIGVTPAESVHSTLSFDTIEGGVATNIVPDRCAVTFNRRLLPFEDLAVARVELLSFFERAATADTRVRYAYREIYATPATLVPSDAPLVGIAQRAIRALGLAPELLISAGSDDQRFIVHDAEIANSIVYGPGQTGLSHTSDEYILIDDLVAGTKGLALILYDYLTAAL